MKTACVLTTINVPKVLALYAKYSPEVMFFVIGDRKTPDMQVVEFLTAHVSNHAYYGIDRQYQLGWKCARLIPENCIQRRNIGFLEALKWGADVVVSIDDDNIPMDKNYFADMDFTLQEAADLKGLLYSKTLFNGLKVNSLSGWFDVGALLQPKAEHRGFPHTKRAEPVFSPVTDAKIGVAAGICLGDPDISAAERIANGPTVHNASELLRSGIVVDPKETWTVFNSQNTAIIRELIPAWFMFPSVGRFDDIYASLIVQAVAREKGYHIHFGAPFVHQERNAHDLIKDLRAEIDGMEHVVDFARILDQSVRFAADENPARSIWKVFSKIPWFSGDLIIAWDAWLADCEKAIR